MRFTLHINGWRRRITVPAAGRHNVANCAAAAAIATAAGVEPGVVAAGLASYRGGDKRLQIVEMANGITIVNDSYNANPASVRAALETVGGFGNGCARVAVLGDMLELGAGARAAHRRTGSLAAKLGFTFLALTGNYGDEAAAGAAEAGMPGAGIKVCADTAGIVDWLVDLHCGDRLRPGDWILVKGSRGMKMERVVTGLEKKWGKKG